MKLIIGLGNPSKEYNKTRHNIGFMVLDKLGLGFKREKKFKAEIAKKNNLIFAKPQSYMNLSGESVRLISRFYKIKTKDIWVIHDDKDMVFGKIRIRHQGSAGGHNGIKSIIKNLGTEEFNRLKIGIGQEKITVGTPRRGVPTVANFVLGKFSKTEKEMLPEIINAAVETLQCNVSIK